MSSAELVASPCAAMMSRSHQAPARDEHGGDLEGHPAEAGHDRRWRPGPRRRPSPRANGASVRPAWMAEKCSPNCRYTVSASRVPVIPAKNTTTQAEPGAVAAVPEDAGLDQGAAARAGRGGGSRPPAARRPARSPPSSGTSRPASPPRGPGSAGRPAGPSRPRRARCPARPGAGRRGARDSGMIRTAPMAVATASGRLTTKMSRHPVPNASRLTSAPPMIGPSTADNPMTGPKTAKAVPSSARGKTSRMMPRPCGMSSAAAAPCARRQPISIAGLTASAAASDATAKPAEPEHEHPLAPVPVTEPGPGDQADREGEGVPADDPLQRGRCWRAARS